MRALALALAATTACASSAAQARRDERVRAELDAYRFARPLAEVWPAALRLLADRGAQLVGRDRVTVGAPPAGLYRRLTGGGFETTRAGVNGRALETMEDASRTRYRVDGADLEGGGSTVGVTAIRRTGGAPSEERTRALDLELELVRRFDPDAAARITAVVEAP